MLEPRKRGKKFHADFSIGHVHLVRGALGTSNAEAARQLIRRLEMAIFQGPRSDLWAELKPVLPPLTYARFANYVGVKNEVAATWVELRDKFFAEMEQRLKIGDLATSTAEAYRRVMRDFEVFLNTRKKPITLLRDIDKNLTEQYKYWQIENMQRKTGPTGGSGYVVHAAHLHRLFNFAIERNMVSENPVIYERRPDDPARGAQPFEKEELILLRRHAGDDLLVLTVFQLTGLRISDAASLIWDEVDFERKEIRKPTKKSRYKKIAIIPMRKELLSALERERVARSPKPSDLILLNPKLGKPVTIDHLNYRLEMLGKRAGVANVHPHRFRDTFAVDALLRGIPESSVARMLADTPAMVTKHYLPFVKALREHTRQLLDAGTGLGDFGASHLRHNGSKRGASKQKQLSLTYADSAA